VYGDRHVKYVQVCIWRQARKIRASVYGDRHVEYVQVCMGLACEGRVCMETDV
jgi:hypothetical protein